MGTSTKVSTFVIGDIQGCFDELQELLKKCLFDQRNDCLWFAGDLINRGPKNLETMKFVLNQKNSVVVLGNHDLHFLAVSKKNIPLPVLIHFKIFSIVMNEMISLIFYDIRNSYTTTLKKNAPWCMRDYLLYGI